MTTIEDLSPELLVEIFSQFIESEGHMAFSRNVVSVCKTWWNLSSTPSLWKNIEVRNWKYVASLSKRGLLRHTHSLKISHAANPSDAAERVSVDGSRLLSVLPHIHELKALVISNHVDADTMKIVARHCPSLERLYMDFVGSSDYGKITLKELDPVLTTCGRKLRRLDFICCRVKNSERLIKQIAAKCPSLEVFVWCNPGSKFPIDILGQGCLRLRKLEILGCEVVAKSDDNYFGFKELTVFKASCCDFRGGSDLSSLLKNSINLEYLHLRGNDNLILNNVSKIPSNKVRYFNVSLRHDDANLVALERMVDKWKYSLLHLKIAGWHRDITSVLKSLLDDNLCPELNVLHIGIGHVDRCFLKMFIQKCQHLKEFRYAKASCGNRDEVAKFQDSL